MDTNARNLISEASCEVQSLTPSVVALALLVGVSAHDFANAIHNEETKAGYLASVIGELVKVKIAEAKKNEKNTK